MGLSQLLGNFLGLYPSGVSYPNSPLNERVLEISISILDSDPGESKIMPQFRVLLYYSNEKDVVGTTGIFSSSSCD